MISPHVLEHLFLVVRTCPGTQAVQVSMAPAHLKQLEAHVKHVLLISTERIGQVVMQVWETMSSLSYTLHSVQYVKFPEHFLQFESQSIHSLEVEL